MFIPLENLFCYWEGEAQANRTFRVVSAFPIGRVVEKIIFLTETERQHVRDRNLNAQRSKGLQCVNIVDRGNYQNIALTDNRIVPFGV